MTKILAFAGEKQSGKSSAGNLISGEILLQNGIIKRYALNSEGKLIVNALYKNEDGSSYEDDGILDFDRRDPEFFEYASRNIWPYVKLYSFAEYLKEMCINLFGLDRECVYGTNDQKNKETKIKWSTLKTISKKNYQKNGYVTHREFLEFFGTDVCRSINPSCWSGATLEQIKTESPAYTIITDCRFEDEVDAINKAGGHVIRLNKSLNEANKPSSELINNVSEDKFKLTINNQDMSLQDKSDAILSHLHSVGYFN